MAGAILAQRAATNAFARTPLVTAADVITNGGFDSDTAWAGTGYSGKTISGGRANFSSSPSYDGFVQSGLTLAAGGYYELTWTIIGYVSGNVYPQVFGGSTINGTVRSANGTYSERILTHTGSNGFGFQMETGGTLSVDNVTLIGPYTTSTVGGS